MAVDEIEEKTLLDLSRAQREAFNKAQWKPTIKPKG